MNGRRKPASARKGLTRMLVFLALLLLAGGGMLALHTIRAPNELGQVQAILLGLLVAAGAAIWVGFALVDHHFDDLERLRGLLLMAAGRDEVLPADWPVLDAPDRETAAMATATRHAIEACRVRGGSTDARLAAVVAAAAEGLLVMTESGLVSLINAAARQVLGAEAVAVGTSVYAALERDRMVEIEHRARGAGAAIAAELPLVDGRRIEALVAPLGAHGGFVISLPHREPGTAGEVDHDLSLHDRPPPARVDPALPARDLSLADLPVLVFDSETTGLDVASVRIVSLGAVRTHGSRLYSRVNLDCLVNPGIAIPPPSVAVHGISDAMVTAAPDFRAAWPRLEEMLDGTVVVGHSIGFDLAILKAECGRAGLAWRTPPALDTALLYSALYPKEKDIGLESLAARFGIEIEGRHTALGDALVTAEVWIALMAQLLDAGIATYGAAREFSARAGILLAQQRRAGWLPAVGDDGTGGTHG